MGIYPLLGDNLEKYLIIPDVEATPKIYPLTGTSSVRDEPAAYQVVGEVIAHQANDG